MKFQRHHYQNQSYLPVSSLIDKLKRKTPDLISQLRKEPFYDAKEVSRYKLLIVDSEILGQTHRH